MNDILDKYECSYCDRELRRRIVPCNIETQGEIKYCPFCGEKYKEDYGDYKDN